MSGYNKVFWGMILVAIPFRINNLYLLTIIGYIVIVGGINKILEEKSYKALKVTAKICIILIILKLLQAIFNINIRLNGDNNLPQLIYILFLAIVEVIMMCNLLKGSERILRDRKNAFIEEKRKEIHQVNILVEVVKITEEGRDSVLARRSNEFQSGCIVLQILACLYLINGWLTRSSAHISEAFKLFMCIKISLAFLMKDLRD